MSFTIKLVVSGIIIIFVIVTGMWVSRLDRPINTGALTVHNTTTPIIRLTFHF